MAHVFGFAFFAGRQFGREPGGCAGRGHTSETGGYLGRTKG